MAQFACIVLAALAALALLLSEITAALGIPLWLLAVGLSWRNLAAESPVGLRLSSADVLTLDWPDGRESLQELLALRVLGRLSVLRLRANQRVWWLTLWPGQLSDAERKALRRRLAGGPRTLDTR